MKKRKRFSDSKGNYMYVGDFVKMRDFETNHIGQIKKETKEDHVVYVSWSSGLKGPIHLRYLTKVEPEELI